MTIFAQKLAAVKLWRDDEEPTVFIEQSWWEYRQWITKAMEAEIKANPAVLDQFNLRPRWRQAVALRYAVDGGKPRTYRAIGEIMGLSQERVRQMINRVLRQLTGDEHRRLQHDLDPDPNIPIRYMKPDRQPEWVS